MLKKATSNSKSSNFIDAIGFAFVTLQNFYDFWFGKWSCANVVVSSPSSFQVPPNMSIKNEETRLKMDDNVFPC